MALLLSGLYFAVFVLIIGKFLYDRRNLIFLNIPNPALSSNIVYPVIALGLVSAEYRFKRIGEYCFTYPDWFKFWFGPKFMVWINSPEKIQKVLSSQKCLEKWNFFYGLMERDYGLISGSVKEKWRDHRKFFNFSFNLKILESFLPTFIDYSEVLCDNLEKKVEDGKEFDFFLYAKKISFDILCATSLGTNMKDYSNKPLYEKVFHAYETTELAMNAKFSIPFLYPQTLFKFTKLYRGEKKAQKILNEFQRDILNERRKIIGKSKLNANNNDGETVERNILIDHIILNEENFTEREILDHILTFVSGYETWANALAHGMLLLAMHPEVQEQLHHEIKTNIKSQEDLKNSQNVNNLPYLDMVFKEILRLLPTVPMILRETLEDFEIEPGVVIPKETNILIHFYCLHRHKHIWGEDADEFKPERFQPELVAKRHQFSFLPFSSGSRICIGYKYSIISLKIAIILLLQRFKFNTSMAMKDIRLRSYISLKLCTPHLLSIGKRN